MISLHYATTEAPLYPLPNGATISTGEAVICPRLEKYLLLNYENSTGELDLDDPPGLQIVSPSVVDPTRAPAGCHTVKIETNLPYNLKQGPKHWDDIKDQVADSLLNHFRKFAPNLTPDKIIGKFIQSPLVIERMNPAMWRGRCTCRRIQFGAERTDATGSWMGRIPHAHSGPVSDRRVYSTWRLGHGCSWPQRGGRYPQGVWPQP
ncbi:MAG TPA: hypothetical protein VMU26_05335 [Candidatus Polarisedimenticolia bacterium]|nr:hypothetical protein [Candidatus Polarisedimenticolia bacterium]